MVAEIGDITRFPSARKLASWAGLTPTVRGSDLHVRHGHISKQGSVWLRWAMNQAAQTAKRSREFATAYSGITKRRGKKIATIAIARKLLTRAWHLLDATTLSPAKGTPKASTSTSAPVAVKTTPKATHTASPAPVITPKVTHTATRAPKQVPGPALAWLTSGGPITHISSLPTAVVV